MYISPFISKPVSVGRGTLWTRPFAEILRKNSM